MLSLNDVLNNGREERTEEINGRLYVGVSPRIECVDGFNISVQCNETAYCTPRLNLPDVAGYTEFELGFPNALDPLLDEYAEVMDTTETVFPYVPRSVVEELIAKHGGIK